MFHEIHLCSFILISAVSFCILVNTFDILLEPNASPLIDPSRKSIPKILIFVHSLIFRLRRRRIYHLILKSKISFVDFSFLEHIIFVYSIYLSYRYRLSIFLPIFTIATIYFRLFYNQTTYQRYIVSLQEYKDVYLKGISILILGILLFVRFILSIDIIVSGFYLSENHIVKTIFSLYVYFVFIF